ncbi:Stk1 family PASTA domain-containing Ser/Thr kinase [Frankia sp. AgB1.9]|uniref:Stk1 family PASTA domain-containing Ser/Thr kinase n=1 Tax=unclassified Frankia TaxID=2632575 RepID=UPI001932C79E|nr:MULTISPECIES: Stk1 family PASTA domain-containing Ser/Thr kinase [unclassified Frankia]MBL7489902.1 Stk1 family PASTA domain-containing Ser/Thr kinase [Frankia sp. AgW1.1]MBL7549846.1 Stk1 family PASTA domain-containing Ser/Thr kinase [Frankia sp. AgB1.9]MBL7622797.1 Stk1 family PASTA domain-containing Ser/Thr kinase [Frankia sp. AgB1.8]
MTDVTDLYGTEPRLVGDRYELGAGIGYGGMAEVYRGRDIRLGRDVAIKVLRSDLARDPNFLKRFQREAQSAAGLNHPAIVSVYDTGEDIINGSRLPYIVMEFVEGRTLREVLQQEGPFPERRAMEITSDICAALDYSHRLGIIHRDVKPANVMLSPDGSVKVMDFGIAKANNATSSTMTATQAVIGTAQYLSPEQAQGKKVDARSDVYSTGVLFYELLTGEPPFRGDNPVAVAYQHVREIPDPPSRHNPQLSAAADAVTLHALEKEPDDRYGSAGEMRDDLERALAGRRVVAQQSGRPTAGGAAAATQIARGGYRDDPRTGGYDTYDRYGDTGYQDSGYEAGAYRQSGETRTRGGYAPVGGYTDQFERFPPDDNRYGGSGGAAPPPQRGSNAWKWVLAGLAVVLTFVVVSLVATSLLSNKGGGSGGGGSNSEATIPKGLKGQTQTVVKNQLTDLGFTHFATPVQKKVTDGTAPDTVLNIDPAEGSKVPLTTTITLTVAIAPDQIQVPGDVVGQTASAARAELEQRGFQVDQQTYSDSNNPPKQKPGRVEKTDPVAGQPAGQGTTVIIYVVSSQVNVGSYIGQSVSSAQAALTQLGLNNTVQQQPSDQAPGTVIDQNPKNATVNRGDTITLVVAAQATSSPTGTPSTGVTPTLPGLPTSGTTGPGHGGGTATPSPTG